MLRTSRSTGIIGVATKEGLDAQGRCRSLEGSRIDGRHPDAGFVDLEQVGDKMIEVDIVVSEVVEREFLAVPGMC
jgi:hypothetical protein